MGSSAEERQLAMQQLWALPVTVAILCTFVHMNPQSTLASFAEMQVDILGYKVTWVSVVLLAIAAWFLLKLVELVGKHGAMLVYCGKFMLLATLAFHPPCAGMRDR